MANEWYYAKDGQQKGPVSARELKRLAAQGMLSAEDLVWREGLADWTPAGRIRGLLPAGSVASRPLIRPVDEGPSSSLDSFIRKASPRRSGLGQILLLLSSLLFIGAFCTPWWKMTFTARDDSDGEGIWNHRLSYMQYPGLNLRTMKNGTNGTGDGRADKGHWARKLAEVISALPSSDEIENAVEYAETRQASSDKKEKAARKEAISFLKLYKRNRKWWAQHLKKGDTPFADRLEQEAEKTDDAEGLKLSLWIWGWNESLGILGLVFGVVVFIFTLVFLLVPILRNWSWIVAFLAMVLGVLVLIFSLMWIIQSPGDDVGDIFSQRLLAGPYLLLGGAALFFLVGLLDTIFGLSFLIRSSRRRRYA